MDLQGYRTYARTYFDLDEEDMSDPLIDQWVDEGHRRIARATRRWPHYESAVTFNTVAGTDEYTVDLKDIENAESIDGELRSMAASDAERMFFINGSPEVGQPHAYSLWAGKVRIWPRPDAAYEVRMRGYRAATSITSGGAGAEPDMPDDFDHVLLAYVMHKAFLHQDDIENAQIQKATYEEALRSLLGDELSAPLDGPIILNSRRSRATLPSRLRFPFE